MGAVTEVRDDLVNEWRQVQDAYLRTSNAIDRELEAKHQIGFNEFEILDLLAEHGAQSCRMKDLAIDSPLTQSALSRIVDRLEKAGLVHRKACEGDRRSLYVGLTHEGAELYQKAVISQRAVLAEQLSRAQDLSNSEQLSKAQQDVG